MKMHMKTYTVEEIAKSLKIHPYTVRRLCREDKIPAFKIGGQWRFDLEEVEKWVKSQRKKKTK